MQGGSRLSSYTFQTILLYFTMLSFYIHFLIPLFLIYPHKLFSIWLGPGTVYLACVRLIVLFVPFITYSNVLTTKGITWQMTTNVPSEGTGSTMTGILSYIKTKLIYFLLECLKK